jgi:hypothetical protein
LVQLDLGGQLHSHIIALLFHFKQKAVEALLPLHADCYRYLFEGSASRFKCVQAGRLDGFHRSDQPTLRHVRPSIEAILLTARRYRYSSGHEPVSGITANNDNNILKNDKSCVIV